MRAARSVCVNLIFFNCVGVGWFDCYALQVRCLWMIFVSSVKFKLA